MKKTLEFIIKEFNHKDRLSIVTFDSNVQVVLPLTAMNQGGKVCLVSLLSNKIKEIATKTVQDLHVRGSTALAPGLLQVSFSIFLN